MYKMVYVSEPDEAITLAGQGTSKYTNVTTMGEEHEMHGQMVKCSFPTVVVYVLCCRPTHSNYLVTPSVSCVKR